MKSENPFLGKHLFICGVGYLGYRIAKQALAKGMQVSGLTRSNEKAAGLTGEGIQMIHADLVEKRWYTEITKPVDYVLNCVSAGGGGINNYRHAYLEGMHSLLQWTAGGFSGRLIYTSSTGVYPFSDGELVDEETAFEAQSETSEVLLASEEFLQRSGPDGWAILRLAGIYGPERHYLLNQIRSGEDVLPGEGEVYLNLIRVEDICSAIWKVWKASENSLNTIYNVADDQPALKREVVQWLVEETKQKMPTFDPHKSIRQRHLPNVKLPNRIISNKKLKAATCWSPEFPSFREGFADLL
ncbi:MAG: hypothetical protein CMI18_02595 [Opitutaceae bacterium]|nr:hypothetical protein [Opitutaceae bacterium]|tara:strand:+ start:529 stop:1425 length:897 start_codon:yes stop_codon:yes gene_type:complete